MRIFFTLLFLSFSIYGISQCTGNDCAICDITVEITETNATQIVSTSTVSGTINAGSEGTGNALQVEAIDCGTISFIIEITFNWQQGVNINWIHGVSFDASSGWSSAAGIVPNNWVFENSITGDCSNVTYGMGGFYFDGTGQSSQCIGPNGGANDGDPSNNWGVNCTDDCPTFGFKLEYCPIESGDVEETISFIFTDDGETGDWDMPAGCIFTVDIPIQILSSGIQIPEQFGPICSGESIDIDAGTGCNSYEWNTGETTNVITVQPAKTTTYSVTVGADMCEIIGEVEVLVEECCEAEIGTITATPNQLCPGEETSISIIGNNDEEGYFTNILIVDANNEIVEIIENSSGSYIYGSCGEFDIYGWNYWEDSISITPVVGDDINIIDCSDEEECCELISTTVNFEDSELPVFTNPLDDVTYSCIDQLPTMEELDWTDNCLGMGTVTGLEDNSTTECEGGIITRTWSVIDSCDNEIIHSQSITIEPLPPPVFIMPPNDSIITCEIAEIFEPIILDYTNSASGDCEIMGSITPTSEGNFELCGSQVTYTWEYTDQCDRTITHSQIVTVLEVGAANEFIDPPENITLSCEEWIVFTPAVLSYSNDQSGNCEISGSVNAVTSDIHEPCGSNVVYTWEFTDQCNRTITHSQTVTIEPTLQSSFVDPPGDVTINCEELQTFSPAVLSYTNGGIGSCLIEGTVDPESDGTLDICGNSVTYVWEYTDDCDRTINHSQTVTVEPIAEASFVDPPGDVTINCDELQTFSPAVLSYTNGGIGSCLIEGTVDPEGDGTLDICGNSVTYTWEYTDDCDRTINHSQTVTVEPIAEASFVDPPGDVTINCDELQTFSPAVLSYTNGGIGSCLIEGTVDPVGDGTLDICGNSVTYTWEYTDDCDRTINHSQTVTVEPIAEASFVDPPGDVTINCDELQTFTPAVLSYTNGGIGSCLIEGTVDPVGDGTLDICGNSVTYVWEYTDDCDRTINHSQTVTVEPIAEASFVDPPDDVTINCEELQTFTPAVLSYTNGGSGSCLIEGTVDPEGDGTLDICGNSVTYTWEYTDDCDRTINHSQTVTVEPIAEASFVDPPGDVTINCDELQTFTPAVLSYTNGGSGSCLIEGTVDPEGDGTLDICGNSVTYVWEYTDDCDRTINHSQTVTVEPIAEASFVDPPGDVTINCEELQTFSPAVLSYTNGGSGSCLIEGTVDPVGDGTLDICGNSVTYTWEYTDDCDRTINHSQTVTVEPIAEASFVDPPGDVTINCEELQTFTPAVLSYTNGGIGSCLIEGTVDPEGDGTLDICGNSVTYTWEYTDDCDRTINHSQTVTVEPIAEASFVDPPGDVTINCDELQTFTPAVLSYTNGGSGSCLIEGTVDPVGDGTLDICGNSVTYVWEYTDDCDRTINHSQTVTVEPIAEASFVDPPSDMTLSCDTKPEAGEGMELMYTNGGADACEIAGSVAPTEEYNVDECGGTIVYSWEYIDDCDRMINHTQTLTIEPAPQAQYENLPPSSITIECNEHVDDGPTLIVTNGLTDDCMIASEVIPVKVGDADICGGSFEFVWEYTDDCGRTTSFTQTVNVNPAPIASFDSSPGEITISCSGTNDSPEDLSYSNGETGDCQISGSVSGVREGTVDYCGGLLVDVWEFTDACGRPITYERDVIVDPAPPASYINPPVDITVDCSDVGSVSTTLNYTNGEAGICLISGTSTAVVSGSYDACGGSLLYTWSFVDLCGRPISHSQTITVDPAPAPEFIDPPVNISLGCDEVYGGADPLGYTNGETGDCEITGIVNATSEQIDNVITNTWELILPCSGDILTHVQTVTLSVVPDIELMPTNIFLCLGETYDLSEISVTDNNGTNITITYHDAIPPNAGNEIGAEVSPTSDIFYVINVVNEFGCEDYDLVNFFIEEPPYAGGDQSTTVCSDGVPVDLFNFLDLDADMNGSWFDLDGIGANLSNPNGATFTNVPAGNYNLYYIVFGTTVCENDTMVLNIEVIEDVFFEITEITCIGSNDFYEVYLNSYGYDIQVSDGDLIQISGNDYVVTDIPITTGVYITAFEPVSGCFYAEYVDIPDCDCSDIDPPTGDDVSICEDDQPYEIAVNVPSGMTANWYLAQNSTTAIVEGSTTFILQDSMAGFFSFFVETYDPATDCSSNTKLKIDVEINALPEVVDTFENVCDVQDDGEEEVTLADFNSLINDNPVNTFSYFSTLSDAEAGINELSGDITISIGTTDLYVRVESSAGCVSIGELSLLLNDLPEADVEATAPTCIGEEDGVITIAEVDVDGMMETSIDGVSYDTSVEYTGLSADLYTVYIRDENGCISEYEVEIPAGLDIVVTNFSFACDDNGTNTDPSDDYYTVTVLIENNMGNSGTYQLIFDGSVQHTFSYGVSESFTIPTDEGNNLEITIEDVEFLCSEVQTIGPLNPCSTNCEITIDELEYECNNNGTETDPTDDFYTVTINASALNGSQNNTYNVFLDGVLLYNFTYGVEESFDVDANGNNLNITCQDNEDLQCQTSTDIGPLVACSEGCQIELNVVSFVCDNNNTSTNQGDDFYTFTLSGTILNGSGLEDFELFIDGVSEGIYNYDEEFSVDIPADGMVHTISINDNSNSGCTDEEATIALINCSTDCEVILNSMDEECFDNVTPTDSSDDYYEITINVSSVNGAANGLFNLIVDGNFVDDYPYDTDNVITLPADGSIHDITIQDSEELACTLDLETSMLTPCSEACLIELVIQEYECSDNGTATNVDDDTYTFTLVGNLLNGDSNTSFELFVDGVLEGTYAYGEVINLDIPADGIAHLLSIVDSDDGSCSFEVSTIDLISCSTDCEILVDDIEYECFDNGTPTDSSDDYIEVTISASAVNGASNNMYNLYVDGILEGIYSYDSEVVISLPANGETVVLRVQDSEELACTLEVETSALESCSSSCLNELVIESYECSDNGTATNVDDDTYTFTLVGNLLNGDNNTSFELFVDGVMEGTYAYGEVINLDIPADGNIHVLSIVDGDDSECDYEVSTIELVSCSTDCEIILGDIEYECFDNGTPTDSSDDYIEISITPGSINGASSNMYNLYVDGVLEGIYSYNEENIISVPAQGQRVELRIQDSEDLQCDISIETDVLMSCSDGCLIGINIISVECFDNGTPTDVTDDYYEIEVGAEVLNGITGSTYEVYVDNVLDGTSAYGDNVVLTIPADNASHEISISDVDDTDCTDSYQTDVLNSCSTDCEITLENVLLECDDNGTLDDPSDDTYTLSLVATSINGGTSFELVLSGVSQGNYNYGEDVEIELPADGSTLIISLTDNSDDQCVYNDVLGNLTPCSNLCTIEPMILATECYDNGTPIDPSDDYWEVTVLVNPANGVVAPNYDLFVDGIQEGTYPYSEEVIITIGADGSSHTLLVSDVDDMTCSASLMTSILEVCSTPCEITGTYDNVSCDNNGTNDTGTDDIFYADVVISNPIQGEFSIPALGIDGDFGDVINVGPFNISDGNITLEIFDANQMLCFINLEIEAPEPCSECSQTVDAGVGGTISCEITEISLAGTSSEVGDYYWYGPAGNLISEDLTATAVSVGTYTFRVEFTDGCIAEDVVVVDADTDVPVAIVVDNGDITCEKASSVLDGSSSGSTDDYFFNWYDEDGNLLSEEQILEVNEEGVYYLQIESKANNCKSALEPVLIEELTNEPTAIIYAEPSNVIDCVIETIVLTTDEEENVNYTWSINGVTVDNTLEIEISDIGTYGLLAVDTITGCSNEADIVISSLVDYPNISLEGEMLDCENEEIVIYASSLQVVPNPSSYWENSGGSVVAEGQDSLIVSEPGEYYYTLIDNDNGCENTDSILIEEFENEVFIDVIPEITYIEGQSVILTASVNLNSGEIESVSWSPDENMSCSTCLSTRVDDPTDSIYVITVVDIYGCVGEAEIRLIKKDKPEVTIPNIINPKSNSGNSNFTLYGNEEVDRILKLQVFDRWGSIVFSTENIAANTPSLGWDGKFNGQYVEQGVYVYLIEVLYVDSSVELYHGDVTIIR